MRLVLQIIDFGSIAAQPTRGQRGAAERGEEHKSAAEVKFMCYDPCVQCHYRTSALRSVAYSWSCL